MAISTRGPPLAASRADSQVAGSAASSGTPVGIRVSPRVIPPACQPGCPPQRRHTADAVLHTGAGSTGLRGAVSIRRTKSSDGGNSSNSRHGSCGAQLVDGVAAGRHRNRPHADGVGAVDVVRRVADDERVGLAERAGRAARAASPAARSSPARRRPRRTRRRERTTTARSASAWRARRRGCCRSAGTTARRRDRARCSRISPHVRQHVPDLARQAGRQQLLVAAHQALEHLFVRWQPQRLERAHRDLIVGQPGDADRAPAGSRGR